MSFLSYLSPVAAVANSGFGRSLADAFTGRGARRDIDAGIGAVNQGRDAGIGAIRAGGAEARGYMQPWLDRGGRRMYDATLGLSGDAARKAAQDTYFSDDVLRRSMAEQLKRAGWASNSRGEGAGLDTRSYGPPSGAWAQGANRVMLQNYGGWQNRLAGVAQDEGNAANTAAGIAAGEGRDIAGVYNGSNAAIANLYGQRAQTENALAQNLIGIGGVAARFFGGGNRIG